MSALPVLINCYYLSCGGEVASWLLHSTLDRAVRARRRGGLIGSALDSRSNGQGSSPGSGVRGHCAEGVTLRWTSIAAKGENKYSQSLHIREIGVIDHATLLVCRLYHYPRYFCAMSLLSSLYVC